MSKLFNLISFAAVFVASAVNAQVVNGDFSQVIQYPALGNQPAYLPGAVGWQIVPSYNAGVTGGRGSVLVLSGSLPTSPYRVRPSVATQSFSNLAAGDYTLSFSYRVVGNEATNNLVATFANTTQVFRWTPTVGFVQYVSKPITFAGGSTTLSFGTKNLARTFDPTTNSTSSQVYVDNVTLTRITPAVPEPETPALMLAGLSAIAFMSRRRKPT
jgi:PEP-CTERM motif